MILHDPYIKIGRINATVAKKAHIKCADVYINRNHITHILKRHNVEIVEGLGFSPIDYVKLVVKSFNQIRKGTDDSLLLVMYIDDSDLHNTAAICLNYVPNYEFWEVKTAHPRRTSEVIKKERLW